jgi:hypothetical protein
MTYETCRDVSEEIWKDFENCDPREITDRTGALYQEGVFHLPFLDGPCSWRRSGGRCR